MTKGKLIVKYGPMGGAKTTWLIHQYTLNSLVFLPDTDHRSGTTLKAHNGQVLEVPAKVVKHDRVESIVKEVKLTLAKGKLERILIDELNFFNQDLVPVIKQVLDLGVDVYAAGLMLDTDKQDFGATKAVVSFADESEEVMARCDCPDCREPAIYNYFKGQKPGQVVVGAFDVYGCACPKHWTDFRNKFGQKV